MEIRGPTSSILSTINHDLFMLQVNPPYYVRLVELVPHPETLPKAMDVAFDLMTEVGQAPVRLRKEIDGFALNRVQYAIIAECWRLVKVSPIRSPMSLTQQIFYSTCVFHYITYALTSQITFKQHLYRCLFMQLSKLPIIWQQHNALWLI